MKIKPNYIISGIFYPKKQILKFQNKNEIISDEDIINLFVGFVKLIKKSVEFKLESKYVREINRLKKELDIQNKV